MLCIMENLKMANHKKGIHRDSIKTQLSRLGMDVFFSDEKTPRGQKVKAEKKDPPKKVLKSYKKYEKQTQKKPLPKKQVADSPNGTDFFDMVEADLRKARIAEKIKSLKEKISS